MVNLSLEICSSAENVVLGHGYPLSFQPDRTYTSAKWNDSSAAVQMQQCKAAIACVPIVLSAHDKPNIHSTEAHTLPN